MINIQETIWAVGPGAAQHIQAIAANLDIGDFVHQRRPLEIVNGIGIVDVRGVLMRNPTHVEKMLGASSYDDILDDCMRAMGQGASGIVLRIDSPGGEAAACFPAARAIAELPNVAAYIEGSGTSAAYAIAAAAGKGIVAHPGAIVGSVGTIISWLDWSEAMTAAGVKPDAITNEGATLKSAFHVLPLSSEQRAHYQAIANYYGKQFQEFVSERRDLDEEEVYKAGWYPAEIAGKLGLVDEYGDIENAMRLLKI